MIVLSSGINHQGRLTAFCVDFKEAFLMKKIDYKVVNRELTECLVSSL
jgi:hypothetical protein